MVEEIERLRAREKHVLLYFSLLPEPIDGHFAQTDSSPLAVQAQKGISEPRQADFTCPITRLLGP
jgi:hypothetical protein